RGAILLRDDQISEAAAALTRARAGSARLPLADQALLFNNRGGVLLFLGQLPEARAEFRRAASTARRAGVGWTEFHATFNLAYAQYLSGDLAEALAGFEAALAVNAGVSIGRALLS